MWLSGVFDRYPGLKLLIAHSGGTIPFLAGRIDSCVQHERHFPEHQGTKTRGPIRSLDTVLRENIYLDAVIYSSTGIRAAVEKVGVEKVLFGTDHPFFPPLEEGEKKWKSVFTNLDAVTEGRDGDGAGAEAGAGKILGENAVELLGLEVG